MRAPLRVGRLRGRQAACVQRLFQTTDCPRTRLRAQMVLLSSDGYPVAEIAAITHQSDDTVRHWLRRFLDQGWHGLLEAPRSGRPAAITPAIEQFLHDCLQGTPRDFRISRPSWTTDLLAQVVRRRPTWTVKHLARLKPGYAQKKAGLPGCDSIRRVARMSMYKMKPSSACFRP